MFRSILTIICLLFTLVFSVPAIGSSFWKSLTGSNYPEPAEIEVLEQDNKSILLSVTLNGVNIQEREVEGMKFHYLSVPQANWTDETGKPKIPVIRTLLIIPSDNNLRIQVEDEDHTTFDGYKVFPVEKKIVRHTQGESAYIVEEFAFDEKFYSSNKLYPEDQARISFSGYLRDERLVQLEIHPIRYNPQSGELVCHSLMRIRLSYDGITSTTFKGLGSLSGMGQNNIANYANMAAYTPMFSIKEEGDVIYPERLTDYHNADYVIIAPEPFYSSEKLKQLASWRAHYSGLDVAVASAEKLYYSFGGGGSSQDEMIRSFIQYVYNYWKAEHTQDGHVGYILLLGDVEFIPIHISDRMSFEEVVSTDNWYVCVSGDDSMPDVMLGRLPAKSITEMNTMIDKIIQYEQDASYGDWANSALLLTGTVESLYEEMKRARDEYLLPAGYDVKELSVLDGDGASDVVFELNNGYQIVDYAGHGWINGWEIFQTKDIPRLRNDRKQPAIFSLACSTGYFDHPNTDSIAEALLKSRNGAIAFFGSTRLASISDVGFGLSEAVAVSHIYTLGEITMHTKMRLLPNSINMDLYNLLGDPALNLCAARSQPGKAELVISPVDITFDPESPKQEQEVKITVKINNLGSADAPDVTLELRDNDKSGDVIGMHKIAKVPANSKTEVITIWHLPAGQAQHQIFVKIYPADMAIEYYRENNDAAKRLFVSLESEGWPVEASEINLSAPTVADIDGDGDMELLIQSNTARDDKLFIWHHDGQPVSGWPRAIKRTQYDSKSHYFDSSVGPAPAVGDLDGDNIPDIVATFYTREIYAWRNDGSYLPGWPVKTSGYATSSPVLADLDDDGKMEVICGIASGEMQVFKYDGSQFPGWPVSVNRNGHLFPVVTDMDSDSDLEIVALLSPIPKGANANTSALYVWHHNGTLSSGWPVQMHGGDAILPPSTGDLDGDGTAEIVAVSVEGEICNVYLWSHNGELESRWPVTIDSEIKSAVALDDLDRDGDIEIIASSSDNFIYAWHHDGQKVSGWPADTGDYSWNSAPVTGDIDGNGNVEVIFSSYGGVIHAYKSDGTPVKGWPAINEDSFTASPSAIADMDGDGMLELAYSSGSGKIHKLFFPGSFANATGMGWNMLGHDQMHTGSYNTKAILPLPPTDLTASDVPNDKGGSIRLTWRISIDDDKSAGYVIFRTDRYDGKYSILQKVPKGTSDYTDDTAKSGITYWYIVRTSVSSYLSVSSNVASAYSFNNFAPNPPTIYARTGNMDRLIDVWWLVDSRSELAGYKLYYGTSPGSYLDPVNVGKIGHYVIKGLTNGTVYYISVTAYDIDGNESMWSNMVSAVPDDEDTVPPSFLTFYPKEVAEGVAFKIECQISDPSGIYDDPSGKGVYLIWDNDGELLSSFNTLHTSSISPGLFATNAKIPGLSLGEKIIYQVYAQDNDYDWGDPADRTQGISQEQTITVVPAPDEIYNYPNPAGRLTDKTTFRYFVKSDADVKINIYDVSGALMETFESKATGGRYNETEWDISETASGVYIYTVEIQPVSGNRQFLKKKMAIIK